MKFKYGQPLKLKDDIKLKFYVDAIYPAGQLGYQEPHYKILFDDANLIIAESLALVLFQEKVANNDRTQPDNTSQARNLKKMNKDDLIALAAEIDSSGDLTKLRKDELIEIIEGK
jgi:hypothetical protein